MKLNEQRAQQHLAEAEPDVRVSILSWNDEKDAATKHLLEQHGYSYIRSHYRMKIELNEAPPAPKWADGITVQTLADNPSLFRAVYEADDEAFQDHWGYVSHTFEEWERWMSKRENFDPSLWFLAMDGNQIAGISLCADEKELGGWVHILGVLRQWRRKGIGEALLYQSFGEFYRRGIHEVYLGVDASSLTGATRLYKRVGMHVHRQSDTYEKELRAGREISTQSVENYRACVLAFLVLCSKIEGCVLKAHPFQWRANGHDSTSTQSFGAGPHPTGRTGRNRTNASMRYC